MYELSQDNPHKPISYGRPRAPGGRNLILWAGLGQGTSDHAQRFFETRFAVGRQHFSLRGLTWNILMYAKERAGTDLPSGQSYANNPFLVNEDEVEYMHRKILQVENILEAIRTQKLDYVFLQEADFFDHRGTSAWLKQEKNHLIEYFQKELKVLNFQLSYKDRNLLTLYNTHTFKLLLLPEQPNFPVKGHRHYFTQKASGKTVVLTNIHLPYGVSQTENIQSAFSLDLKEGYYCIMGGDANHSPDGSPDQLVTDPRPSNVGALDVTKKSSMGCPVLSVTDASGENKAYDGLFVKVPENVTVNTIVWGEFITLNEDCSAVSFKSFPKPPMPELEPEPEPEPKPKPEKKDVPSVSRLEIHRYGNKKDLRAPPGSGSPTPSGRRHRGGRNAYKS